MRLPLLLSVSLLSCPHLPAALLDPVLDPVSEALVLETEDGKGQLQLGGYINIDTFYTDANKPQGLVIADDKFFFAPRLTLTADAFYGERLYGFVKFRWDRGFDPGYKPGGSARWDEYFIDFSAIPQKLILRGGKFATVFGNWAGRHSSWDNPFIHAPLPYERVTSVVDVAAVPSPSVFIGLKEVPDDAHRWVPVIWGPAYTQGLAALGTLNDRFDYAFSFKNAALSSRPGHWDTLDFAWPTYTARVGHRPSAAWSYGLSASTGPYLVPNFDDPLPAGKEGDDYKQTTVGVDLGYAYGDWQLWAEVIHSEFDVPNVETADVWSYYIEGRRRMTPKIYLGLRWGQQFFEEIDDGMGGEEPWDLDIWRAEAALTYRVDRHLQLKAQYGFSDQNGENEQGRQFAALQATLRF